MAPEETIPDEEIPPTTEPSAWGGDERRNKKNSRRQSIVDRRSGLDGRLGLDRRRGPGRRRTDSRRSAEEGEMTDEQFEFVMAVEEYKRVNRRPFPTLTEILDIIQALGYRKVAEPKGLE